MMRRRCFGGLGWSGRVAVESAVQKAKVQRRSMTRLRGLSGGVKLGFSRVSSLSGFWFPFQPHTYLLGPLLGLAF
jgi:hypothetical protein